MLEAKPSFDYSKAEGGVSLGPGKRARCRAVVQEGIPLPTLRAVLTSRKAFCRWKFENINRTVSRNLDMITFCCSSLICMKFNSFS